MNETPADFAIAVSALRDTLQEVRREETVGKSSDLLFELLENQVQAIECFYELLMNEREEKALISGPAFDLLTETHRKVARYFSRLPGVDERSVCEKSIVIDFYYILRRHAEDPV